MLTKRQQVVLGKLSKTFAFLGRMTKRWRFLGDFDDSTSAATLYRLIDAELAALGIDTDGDAVVETTERGDELVELLTTSLTKRQQEVLKELLDSDYAFKSTQADTRGLWSVNFGKYSSASLLYLLADAELIGFGLHDYGFYIAALTPRGRRLAELLP